MSLIRAAGFVRLGAYAIVLACGLAASRTASAQVAPPAEGYKFAPNADYGPGLGFYDARLDADGVPLEKVTAIIAAMRKTPAAGMREADLQKLRGMVDGVVVDDDALLGTARFVRSTWKFLTPPRAAGEKWTAVDVVKEFIVAYPALMEIDAREIDAARVERDYQTDHNGVRHLTFAQQIRGVDLFECEVRANVTRNGELINVQNTMLARPEGDYAAPAIKFDDASAVVIAAANLGIRLGAMPTAKQEPQGAAMRRTWQTPPELRPDEPLATELVYFPVDRNTIHPAWHVEVAQKGVGHTYDILVDAADGSILRRHDRLVWDTTQPVTMRVYLLDGIAPGTPGNATNTSFQFPVVARQLVTMNPSDVSAYSPNGWINDGNTQTVGNNVDAHTDTNADNVADTPRPDGGASRVFDFPFDPAVEPSAQRPAVVTELFYRSNWYHDKLMALGFNEAAGNFQTTNFSGQGLGNDAIQADAQDGSGTNNANFSSQGTDGTAARVQMYLFTNPTPDRDGSFEGDIVYHELTHGTSIRLHHGLSGTQPGGMGEGWSDFVAHCLLAEPADDPDAVYPTGGFTTYLLGSGYTTNYYFGIRRFPYSTDLNKAPQTYADIDTAQINFPASIPRSTVIGNTANEVHNIGEVWCEMLNEGRAAMWHAYGFAGNQRMLQIVIDAMKLDVGNPTLIQARDAILQADNVDYGGVDAGLLWTAFAKRGLGYGATSPASSTTTGVVESYNVPIFATFTYPDGLPTQLQPGVATSFRVNVAGTGLTLTAGSGQISMSINGGAYAPLSMTQAAANQYTATIPAQSCLARASYYFSTDSSAGVKTDPANAPTARYSATVYTGTNNIVTDGFETNTGWTVGPNTATTGLWERATPQATAAQPGAAHAGTFCWVTAAAAGASIGANDVDGGYTTLTSPNYDLSAYSNATVSYWRWYSNAAGSLPNTNTFRVDVSTNGGASWTNAETIGPSGTGTTPAWFQGSWTFSGLGLTPTATVKIRFIAEDATGSIVEAALDDFKIDVVVCTPPTLTGACCTVSTGVCAGATQAACLGASGNTYQGDNTTCSPNPCPPPPPPTGACCALDGSCATTTSAACASGVYQGDATVCSPNPCSPAMYLVSVTRSGSGRGTVASAPAGIACGATCIGSFAHGTALTLAATPDANSVFVGWSGGCAGAGDCVTTLAGAMSAEAQFRCKADFNGAGGIGVQDIFDFLTAWFSAQPGADFNGANGITVQDIFDFLAAWFTGCP
jgi:hypothetical protein